LTKKSQIETTRHSRRSAETSHTVAVPLALPAKIKLLVLSKHKLVTSESQSKVFLSIFNQKIKKIMINEDLILLKNKKKQKQNEYQVNNYDILLCERRHCHMIKHQFDYLKLSLPTESL